MTGSPSPESPGPESSDTEGPGRESTWLSRSATVLFFVVALLFVARLLYYYSTGAGGSTALAVMLVPVAFIVATLDDMRRGELYPRLPIALRAGLGYTTVAAAAAAGAYLTIEFDAIRQSRMAMWTTSDLLAGIVLVVLMLEYCRRKYFALFVLNLVLILYVVYGNLVPGMFQHGGMSWERVVTSMTLETSTGIFQRLSQLALTLIGSFILVLATLRAFGAIDSILKGASKLAVRSPHLLPQSAVVGSFGVAAVSGSGAANATTTGSVTIPALIASGMSRVRAAAIETATSLGGQLMPPLMGIAAFLMADYMGVGYFEVVERGFAPALIYFAGVSLAVYLLAMRVVHRPVVGDPGRFGATDWVNLAGYVLAIAGLIYLMGAERMPPMQAAQRVFYWLFAGLAILFVLRSIRSREAGTEGRQVRVAALVRPFKVFLETFARMTSELTVLLAILGMVTASFTITGVPTNVGRLMVQLGAGSVLAVALIAFVFGYIVGMGLPPAPTYIIVAVVIAPFLTSAGIDPWVVHFYAFLIAVFGELSPPTSVTAAVTSRIAEAPFVRTMFRAIELCIPLLILMVAVFTWPLVQEPGWGQWATALMVLAVVVGVTVSLHGRFGWSPGIDRGARLALGAVSIVLLCWGSVIPAAQVLAVAILAVAVFCVLRMRGTAYGDR